MIESYSFLEDLEIFLNWQIVALRKVAMGLEAKFLNLTRGSFNK